VENFLGMKGQERKNGRKQAGFLKAVAKPHHFLPPFFYTPVAYLDFITCATFQTPFLMI
jgi:hypothetical protein